MSGRRYTRTVHEHAPDPVPIRPGAVVTRPPSALGRAIRAEEGPEPWAALGHGLAVALALLFVVLALLLAAAGLVLGARWLWSRYHDLALALSFLGALVLGVSILWRSVEVLAVHYGTTRPDQVSPETRDRLRREVDG